MNEKLLKMIVQKWKSSSTAQCSNRAEKQNKVGNPEVWMLLHPQIIVGNIFLWMWCDQQRTWIQIEEVIPVAKVIPTDDESVVLVSVAVDWFLVSVFGLPPFSGEHQKKEKAEFVQYCKCSERSLLLESVTETTTTTCETFVAWENRLFCANTEKQAQRSEIIQGGSRRGPKPAE